MAFPLYRQLDSMDCGPTCLRMIAKSYGRDYSLQSLREGSGISRAGVSLLGIAEAAESIGFRTTGVSITKNQLHEAPLPLIAHWRQQHFVVVYRVTKNTIFVADPAHGLLEYSHAEFSKQWLSGHDDGIEIGLALLLETTPQFYEAQGENKETIGFSRLFDYVLPYKGLLIQIVISLLVSSVIQLIFPFLTQSIIDKGVNTQNISFVFVILIAQLGLLAGRMASEFLRSWLLLHTSTRVNIAIISDFLIKLMKLPLSFFDAKMIGDIMRRISDHSRIESFLTSQSLGILFSAFNIFVLSVVLFIFNKNIFFIFFLLSGLYIVWIVMFLKQRRNIDYKNFDLSSKESNVLIQTIQGMQEIKLANAETPSRWRWERLQAKLFKLSIRNLALMQYQQTGGLFINEGKNIFITFLSASAVIHGSITLGTMLAIQQIIGQLNGPLEQIIGFVHQFQDAKISLERLNEIHHLKDEEDKSKYMADQFVNEASDLHIENVTFSYNAAGQIPVLRDINLTIPFGKTTAIVGMSGSGKTTILKLLLKFYQPSNGSIRIGNLSLQDIHHKYWRRLCGVVMQEGYIFSDTIAGNIAVGEEYINNHQLLEALRIANLHEYVTSLPLGHQTMIGADGNGLSQGQKQRILIARAVYKNPSYLFFDEATNSLDASNERQIIENMEEFFKSRTVVVVAHRLSTVRNAHQIVVVDGGKIVEVGSHDVLTAQRGKYYELVKNQLELGS